MKLCGNTFRPSLMFFAAMVLATTGAAAPIPFADYGSGTTIELVSGLGDFALSGQYEAVESLKPKAFCECGMGVTARFGAAGGLWNQTWSGGPWAWYKLRGDRQRDVPGAKRDQGNRSLCRYSRCRRLGVVCQWHDDHCQGADPIPPAKHPGRSSAAGTAAWRARGIRSDRLVLPPVRSARGEPSFAPRLLRADLRFPGLRPDHEAGVLRTHLANGYGPPLWQGRRLIPLSRRGRLCHLIGFPCIPARASECPTSLLGS